MKTTKINSASPRVGIFPSFRRHGARRSIAGFTLVEGIVAVVLLGLLVGLGMPAALNIRNQGIDNAKAANAARLTQLASSAIQAGASVGTGATNNIDLTSATTAATALNTGFTLNGITYKMLPPVGTPASYVFTGSPSATSVIFGYTAGAAALP